MLQNKVILPNGYFEKPSPHIEFARYALRVPTSVEPFVAQDSNTGLIASISSYGFGGNCIRRLISEGLLAEPNL